MSEIDVVKDIAQQVLSVTAATCAKDTWLWDRTQRVLRNVENICLLPELAQKNLPIDKFCLAVAACFSEAGLTRTIPDGSEDFFDSSAQIVVEKLAGILPQQKIDKINKIINESGNRFTNVYEAIILSDARSLDDMGAVGLFGEFRKYAVLGNGVSDILPAWKRKLDYQYFQARLKESFRFESVRKLAQQRYAAVAQFMNQLQIEHAAADFEKLTADSLWKV